MIVAYSGGVDSAFLAWMAHQVLGGQMLAVIADSASLARTHLEDALAFAREREIPVEVVETQELENPAYIRNDAMRCFHCKDELFTVLERYREEMCIRDRCLRPRIHLPSPGKLSRNTGPTTIWCARER